MPSSYTLGASNTPIGPEVRSTPLRTSRARGPKPRHGTPTLFTMKLGEETRFLIAKLQGAWQVKAGLSYAPSAAEVIRLALEIADASESGRKANVPWRAGNTWGTVIPTTPGGTRERGAAAPAATPAEVVRPAKAPAAPKQPKQPRERIVSPREVPEPVTEVAVEVAPEAAPPPTQLSADLCKDLTLIHNKLVAQEGSFDTARSTYNRTTKGLLDLQMAEEKVYVLVSELEKERQRWLKEVPEEARPYFMQPVEVVKAARAGAAVYKHAHASLDPDGRHPGLLPPVEAAITQLVEWRVLLCGEDRGGIEGLRA